MHPDEAAVREALSALGVNLPGDLDAIRRVPYQDGMRMLEELKARVHKAYKRLVFELHPDRTGNDPVKTERFKLVGRICEDINKLRLEPPRPQPARMPVVRQVVVVYRGPFVSATTAGNWGTPTSATTTSTAYGTYATYVSTMRPT